MNPNYKLAIFGGTPAFSENLHVGRPNIGDRQSLLNRIADMLDRRWLTNNGPYVRELEHQISKLIGVKHCICMCNGTVALEIACRAVGMKGEVIVPSFTFVATAHALQWQEITPVFCDVDPLTHCIDPAKLERHITPRTSGILAVHTWGHPCDVEALSAIASRHGIKLVYDAAHAFACSHNGRMIGSFGDAEVFSFHATKFFNTLEGGAIATNNDDLAAKIRLMKNFGFRGTDNVIYIGTNGKMNEASAAMGLTNLESLPEFIAVNLDNYTRYRRGLAHIPGIRVLEYPEHEKCNYQYIIVEVDEYRTGVSRDVLVRILQAENILARRYFYPACHRMEPYRSYFPHAGMLLPETELLTKRVLSLPTGTGVTGGNIETICQIIQMVVSRGAEISARLPLE